VVCGAEHVADDACCDPADPCRERQPAEHDCLLGRVSARLFWLLFVSIHVHEAGCSFCATMWFFFIGCSGVHGGACVGSPQPGRAMSGVACRVVDGVLVVHVSGAVVPHVTGASGGSGWHAKLTAARPICGRASDFGDVFDFLGAPDELLDAHLVFVAGGPVAARRVEAAGGGCGRVVTRFVRHPHTVSVLIRLSAAVCGETESVVFTPPAGLDLKVEGDVVESRAAFDASWRACDGSSEVVVRRVASVCCVCGEAGGVCGCVLGHAEAILGAPFEPCAVCRRVDPNPPSYSTGGDARWVYERALCGRRTGDGGDRFAGGCLQRYKVWKSRRDAAREQAATAWMDVCVAGCVEPGLCRAVSSPFVKPVEPRAAPLNPELWRVDRRVGGLRGVCEL